MIKKVCDKCQKEIDKEGAILSVDGYVAFERYDLCKRCLDNFIHFLKS